MDSSATVVDSSPFFDEYVDPTSIEYYTKVPQVTRRQARKLAKQAQRHKNNRTNSSQYIANTSSQQRAPLTLQAIEPITDRQKKAFDAFRRGDNLVLYGYAGTGKSLVALYLANELIQNPTSEVDKVVIYRSAVSGREIGFLPGTPQAKLEVYEGPYQALFNKIYGSATAYETMKKRGTVAFESTSFSRGLTIDNAVVILEEAQNYGWQEIYTLATRLGPNSRLIITGDIRQNDLNGKYDVSGFGKMLSIFEQIRGITMVENQIEDIVRSSFVKQVIIAATNYENS